MVNFKELLILMYFNTVQNEYFFSDIVELLGLPIKYTDKMIEQLLEKKLLVINEHNLIHLTDKGFNELVSKGLDDTNLIDLYNSENTLQERKGTKIELNDIYIPKNFDKKFQGY